MSVAAAMRGHGPPAKIHDRPILAGLRARDPGALERLFRRYGRLIHHWARTEGQEAEDLVQDVLLSVWRAGPRLRPDTDLPAFLKTVTMNAVRNRWRTKDRRPAVPAGLEPAHGTDTTDPIADQTERLAVEQALGGLSDRERACLTMLYLSDLPLGEVAERLGTSPGAAKSLAARARRRLRAELSRTDQREWDVARRARTAAVVSAIAIAVAVAAITFGRGGTVTPASPRVPLATGVETAPPVEPTVEDDTALPAPAAPETSSQPAAPPSSASEPTEPPTEDERPAEEDPPPPEEPCASEPTITTAMPALDLPAGVPSLDRACRPAR